MLAVLALANDFALPMTGTYLNGPPGTTFSAPVVIFNTPVGLAVGLFLGLSALFHFIVSSGNFFKRESSKRSLQILRVKPQCLQFHKPGLSKQSSQMKRVNIQPI